jgi:HD-GYP domain-containing protein (c-di-GMP phosphodiesterase class II)
VYAFKLKYPVQTLDNQQILPADIEFSEEALETLISSSHNSSPQTLRLLDYGSVKKDILYFFSQPPYQFIFSDQERRDKLLNLMERVSLILPVLESLDYFKLYDPYTYRHILMVFALSTLLAQDMIEDYHDLIEEAMAGPTHDFGKICIPLNILKKTKPLTLKERHIMEHHAIAGYVLISYYYGDTRNFAARVAKDHHERRDGSGYPFGIHLTNRMVEIVVVSDVYDALISPRPYRPTSYENRAALEEITKMAERGELSWGVVQALVSYNRKDKPHYLDCSVSLEKRGIPPKDNIYGVIATENARSSNS